MLHVLTINALNIKASKVQVSKSEAPFHFAAIAIPKHGIVTFFVTNGSALSGIFWRVLAQFGAGPGFASRFGSGSKKLVRPY